MELEKSLENAIVVYSTSPFPLRATLQDNCNTSSDYQLYWEISKCDDKTRVCDSVVHYGGRWKPTGQKVLYPRLFHGTGYLYIRCVYRKQIERTAMSLDIKTYSYGFVRLLRPPLIAKIEGADKVVRGIHTFVKLDASKSYDPDRNSLKTKGMLLHWYCEEETEDEKIHKKSVTEMPNQGNGKLQGCYKFTGEVNNSFPLLIVNLQPVKGNKTLIFTIVIQKEDRIAQVSHRLRVEEPFVFSIGCTLNCGKEISVNRRVVLTTSCTGFRCHKVFKYNWELFQRKTMAKNDWMEVPNFEDKILTNIDSPNLVIPGGEKQILEENSSYKLRAIAILDNGFNIAEEMTFVTNSPPRVEEENGGCFVEPSEGFVAITKFNLSCFGWIDANLPLSYEFRYHTASGMVVMNSGHRSSAIGLLPLGNITVEVHISDSLGASAIQRRQVQVKPIATESVSEMLVSLSGRDSQLTKLIKEGNLNLAAQMAYSILSLVQEADIDPTNKKELKVEVINQIATMEVSGLEQVTQLSAVVVMATKENEDLAVSSQKDVVDLLENMTDLVKYQTGRKESDPDLVQETGGSLLHGLSNALSISTPRANSNGRKSEEMDKATDNNNRKTDQTENKKLASKTLHIMDVLGTSLLATKVLGERSSAFSTDKLSMTLDRQTPVKMSRKTFGKGKEKVTLPSAGTLFRSFSENIESLDVQMTSFTENPFTWDESARGIRSSVVDFRLKTRNGSILEISGLKDPVELFLPVTRHGEKSTNSSGKSYFAKPSNGSSNLRYHRINILSSKAIVFFEIKPERGVFFEVFVSAQKKPTPENYQFKSRVPDFSSCTARSNAIAYSNEHRNCSNNPYEVSISYEITRKTGIHYIGLMYVADKGSKARRRIARSCRGHAGRRKRSCIGVKDPPTTSPPTPGIVIPQYDESTDVNYTMSVTVTSCLYWSEKKQAWINDGCMVGPKTSSGILHCLCTHLSAFGGDFLVAPNPIDFEKVWEQFGLLGETDNFLVLATVCIAYGAYLLGLVWARRADKRDEKKVMGNVYLSDVHSSGYVYRLHVQTGMWTNHGTTARVGIVLYGDEGCSGTISLSASRKVLFARGSVNSFVFSLPQSLGRLFKILVWHDNSGDSPAWFLQQIEIEDCSSGQKWHFLANRWLALEKGAGQIHFEISAANEKDLANFKDLFLFRTARSLGDGHLWLSVFTRPPHVSFTRCQRLSCCISVLFAAMVTNAMFYHFGTAPKDTFKIGPLKMSWTQIKIGIQSSVIAIPINILIVMIFRNSRQKLKDHVYKVSVEETDEKAPGFLPHFFVYIGWGLCILTSLTAAVFVVFYSMMWGKETSNQWLTSIMVSFIQDVFVCQPIKVVLLASFLSLLVKKPPETVKAYGISFHKENDYNKTEEGPPQGKELEEARDFRTKVQAMYKIISEVTLFLLFVVVLMVVCYGNRGPNRFMQTNSLNNSLIAFKGRNTSSFWHWMRGRLCPALFDTRWYNGWMFEYEEGFVGNRELFLVGMPRLRQIRIKQANSCYVTEKVNELTKTFSRCVPPYSSNNEYKTLYNLPNWIPVKNTSKFQTVFELERICPKPWRYRSSSDLNTLSYQGVYSMYDGGGFVADLGYNIRSALNVLNNLEANNWIDEFSVAVFVEFTVFNPASSLFSAVRCLYERFPTGGLHFSKSIQTLTLYKAPSDEFQAFYEVSQLLFMVIIIIFVLSEIVKIYRQRNNYFLGFWNWLQLLHIVTAICAVITFFLKAKYASAFVRRVRLNPFETSSADYIVRWSAIEIYVLSFLIFTVTLKFLRVIRFNRHVCQMMGTLSRAFTPLLSFLLVFVTAILAYTQMAFLLFGSTLDPYSSFFKSLRAVLEMLLGGDLFFFELKANGRILGPLFVFVYMFTMTMITLNLFMAILSEAYFEVVECPRSDFADADLGSFMVVYLLKNLKLLVKRFASFLKNPVFKGKRSKFVGRPKWSRKDWKNSSEIQTLFSTEVERGRVIHTLCPIAVADSLTEIDHNHESNDLKSTLYKLGDCGNISLSLLSIEELYESKEDDELNGLLDDIREVNSSMEVLYRMRESFV